MKVNVLIILLCTVILQSHSIFFWIDITNGYIGIVWSITVEALAMYFWYGKAKILAPLASMVVITSALFHLSASSLKSLDNIQSVDRNIYQTEVLTKVLDSIKDKNYPMTIQKTMKSLERLDKQVSKEGKTTVSVWLSILLQSLALTLVMVGQIKAVLVLSRKEAMPVKKVVTKQAVTAPLNTVAMVLARDTLIALREFGLAKELHSESSIRNVLRLTAPTFSRLRATVETGKGMSEGNMREILKLIKKGNL